MAYDSTNDTLAHIETVQVFLGNCADNIYNRCAHHDESKLKEPEKTMLDRFTPLLASMTYGSDEYKSCLKEMGVGLQHHYMVNGHHPEHYPVPATLKIGELVLLIRHTEGTDPENPSLPWLWQHLKEMQSQVNGMSLLDVLEMLADWKAAGMRHNDGSMGKSMEINRERFKISAQLYEILCNTVRELGW